MCQHFYEKLESNITPCTKATVRVTLRELLSKHEFATLDVISMYTNTPQEEALNACEQAYEKAPKS